MNSPLLDDYEKSAGELSLAIRGLTREDLLKKPGADAKVGLWSIQQVVCHIADAEFVLQDRMKRLIAEPNPTLQAFDENLWTENLAYDALSAEDAGVLVELSRKQFGKVLRSLPDSALTRMGSHSQAGKLSLGDVLKKANDHLHHHMKFIHQKRASMGKEMW